MKTTCSIFKGYEIQFARMKSWKRLIGYFECQSFYSSRFCVTIKVSLLGKKAALMRRAGWKSTWKSVSLEELRPNHSGPVPTAFSQPLCCLKLVWLRAFTVYMHLWLFRIDNHKNDEHWVKMENNSCKYTVLNRCQGTVLYSH